MNYYLYIAFIMTVPCTSTMTTTKTNSATLSRVTPEDADALLAKELHGLSLKDREKVFHDIHGISEVVEETPAFVAQKLAELDTHIATIKPKKAYETAKALDAKYVRSRSLRLPFLRAVGFDASLAAKRIVQFFEAKQELFGTDKLVRDIRLDDLDRDDMAILQSGLGQILPLRDRAGRAIICWFPIARGNSSVLTRVGSEPMDRNEPDRILFFSHCLLFFWCYRSVFYIIA